MTPAPKRVVVVGASLAGLNAIEAARQVGYDRELVLIGDEAHPPYDRPPLSKAMLAPGNEPAIPHLPNAAELESELEVELRLGRPATGLDVGRKVVSVGEDEVPYDAVVIATGVRPRTLPGTEHLAGVHTLRNYDDALAVRRAMDESERVVVIGAGFIGSEIASAARKRGLSVTIIEALPTPLARVVGEDAGAALTRLHRAHGTVVECGAGVEAVEGETAVTGVRLTDGRVFPADLVVVGIGAVPAVEWLAGSGLTLNHGVVCGQTLAAGPEGVWAAGDVARWFNPATGALMRVEHWSNAIDQGICAMENALAPDRAATFSRHPYFWSDWYDSKIQFAGVARGVPTLVAGSWEDDSFVALYGEGDEFRGALTLNRRSELHDLRKLLERQAPMAEALELAEKRRSAR